MKKLIRIINRIVIFNLSVILGSWLGAQARFQLTGELSQGGYFQYKDEHGTSYSNVPIATHLMPGFLLMIIGKPYWLMGLLGSFIASVLVGDHYEKPFLEQLLARLRQFQELSN